MNNDDDKECIVGMQVCAGVLYEYDDIENKNIICTER